VDEAALKDKVVWILGASSGIGEELALQITKAGAKVVLSARREDELKRVAALCMAQGSVTVAPLVLALDVLNDASHGEAVSTILRHFGCLDVAVLNVGRTQRALAEDTAIGVTRQMLELNTVAQIGLALACLPTFLKQQSGAFLVTSSLAGKMPAPASSSYNASKYAIQGWFDALRLEVCDRGVRVCLACPGPVSTPIEASAFTNTVGGVRGKSTEALESKMPVARCVKFMLAALTHGVDEAWISGQPVLLFTYLSQYCPDLARYLGKRFLGPMRTRAFKTGGDVYNFTQMVTGKEESKKA